MLKSIFRYLENISSLEVYVAYVGSFNLNIGPPSSMNSLYNLLNDKVNCRISSNLSNERVELFKLQAEKKRKVSPVGNELTNNRKMQSFLGFLREFKLFLSIIIFNLKCNFIYLVNNDVNIIITQPWLIPISRKMKVVYTRRANVSRYDLVGSGFVRILFEYFFNKFEFIKIVYLVKQETEEVNCYVIPNYFNELDFDIDLPVSNTISYNFAGTWSYRKGAGEIAQLASEIDINVYGAITDDIECNELLSTHGIIYHGSVPHCYNNFYVGDVFLSFSKMEGFQRSVAEAMLRGCLIIAKERPDSLSIQDFPGVYVISHDDDFSLSVKEVLNNISNMSFEQRLSIGKSNRDAAIGMFSKNKVIKLWEELLFCQNQ